MSIIFARIPRAAAMMARSDRGAAGAVPDRRLPCALCGADAAHAARGVDVLDRGRRRAGQLDAGTSSGSSRRETVTKDIHCVTKWSKLDTVWEGVSVDTLLDAGRSTTPSIVLAFCDGGYTTNLPLEDVTDGKAWVAFVYGGEPLEPEHGGPARLLVPHLYFWKSAKWVRGLDLRDEDEPGFWESNGYHIRGDPWLEQRYWGD